MWLKIVRRKSCLNLDLFKSVKINYFHSEIFDNLRYFLRSLCPVLLINRDCRADTGQMAVNAGKRLDRP